MTMSPALRDGVEKERLMIDSRIMRIVIVFAAVALVASNVVGADRVMLAELFTATW